MHCSVSTTGERYSAVDNNYAGYPNSDRRNAVQLGRLLLLLTDLKLHHHRNLLHDYDVEDSNNSQRGGLALALSHDEGEGDEDGSDVRGLDEQNGDDVSNARMSKRAPLCIQSCMGGGMTFIRCKSMCN